MFSATCSSRCKKKTNKQKNHPTNHYQNTTTPNYCYFPEILIDLLFFKEIHYSSEVCHAVFSFHVHEHTVRGWLDWYVQKSIHSRMIENLCHFLTVIQKERKKTKQNKNILRRLSSFFIMKFISQGGKSLVSRETFHLTWKGIINIIQRSAAKNILRTNTYKQPNQSLCSCSGTTNTKMWPLVFRYVYLTLTEYLSVVKNGARHISTLLSKLFSYCTMWLTSSLIILHLSPSKHRPKFCK